jgi:hypothetical protein
MIALLAVFGIGGVSDSHGNSEGPGVRLAGWGGDRADGGWDHGTAEEVGVDGRETDSRQVGGQSPAPWGIRDVDGRESGGYVSRELGTLRHGDCGVLCGPSELPGGNGNAPSGQALNAALVAPAPVLEVPRMLPAEEALGGEWEGDVFVRSDGGEIQQLRRGSEPRPEEILGDSRPVFGDYTGLICSYFGDACGEAIRIVYGPTSRCPNGESTGRTGAVSSGGHLGLFQLSPSWAYVFGYQPAELFGAEVNIRVAYGVWLQNGRRFSGQWSCAEAGW